MRSVSGIYVIRNKKNDKIYIGSSVSVYKRLMAHRADLIASRHGNIHLQRAWDKYGSHNFEFKILERCEPEKILEREQYYLDIYMPRNMCYNISIDATHPTRGRKLSQEHRDKLSAIRKVTRADFGRDMANLKKGKPGNRLGSHMSPEHRQKMSESNKHPKSESMKQKLREHNSVAYEVISPDGAVFKIKGMTAFCELNGLTRSAMCAVARGKRNHHKGWKCRKI